MRGRVMGGSRGIGRSIALAFAAGGAAVAICARGAYALEQARVAIAGYGVPAFVAPADLADAGAIARFVPDAAAALGGVDVLVNNASGFGSSDDETGWAASVGVDLMATVRASQAAQPHLAQSAGSSIINISSITAFRAAKRNPPYAAIKAAVMHYTAGQAHSLAAQGIRVNCVASGSIEFAGGTWERRRTEDPALYKAILAQIPFGRMGTPEEIASVVVFLDSPGAAWITGQTISIDGGQLLGT